MHIALVGSPSLGIWTGSAVSAAGIVSEGCAFFAPPMVPTNKPIRIASSKTIATTEVATLADFDLPGFSSSSSASGTSTSSAGTSTASVSTAASSAISEATFSTSVCTFPQTGQTEISSSSSALQYLQFIFIPLSPILNRSAYPPSLAWICIVCKFCHELFTILSYYNPHT